MPKVQWPRGPGLERVSALGNVPHVQFGASANDLPHGRRLKVPQRRGIALDGVEKCGVADACDLYGLNITGAFVRWLERRQQLEIIDHGEWRTKSADKVLLAERVDAVLDA